MLHPVSRTRNSNRKLQYATGLFKRLQRGGINTELVKLSSYEGTRGGVVGFYCGTGYYAQITIHELAHIIQPSDKDFKRMYIRTKGSLVFKYPEIEICGRICIEPNTNQISLREIETFAIEYLLSLKCGMRIPDVDAYFEEQFSLTQYMPDWWYWTKDERKQEGRQFFDDCLEKWGNLDIVKMLNTRLAKIHKIAEPDPYREYFVFNADQGISSIVSKNQMEAL